MFLRSKVQEMILKRRSRSMNNGASAQQRSHVSDQLACLSTIPCHNSGNAGSGSGGSKGAAAGALFASPRLLHSSSLPTGTVSGKNPAPDAESSETAAFSMSPTSVLDAAASFASGPDGKRRPWRESLHGLADALDCTDQQEETSPSLVRSCSLDRRVEFGVKNKSSWLPLRCGGSEAEPGEAEMIEPSSEDYTCVICRGPNPRTVHIFGDRVVEGGAESSPRLINLPARGEGAFSSL